MHISQALVPKEPLVGGKRFSGTLNTSSNMMMQRPNGSIQAFTHGEAGSSSSFDMHGGYAHHMTKPPHYMPHLPQNSPSRFGQQPVQRFNHGRSTAGHGTEWNHLKVQAPLSSFNSGGPRSPESNGTPWGRRVNHPVTNIPPTSCGRKDYGRIS